ncbi:MAG: hypothetical protein RLN88_06745 [Ekhidna sp.]|uniref:hypothetical protein n=1 Tax=Ekhidna sp. TaxID=2608089 RepID=UPI0032EF3AFD
MIKKYLFILLVAAAGLSNAQGYKKGYIVTFEYDTIQGLLANKSNLNGQKSCVFKETSSSDSKEYFPTDILSYSCDGGRLYISNQVGLDIDRINSTFVRVIVDADMPLYEFDNQFAFRSTSGQIYLLLEEDSFFKQILNVALVPQCFGISGTIKKLELNEESLADLFVKYNRCVGNPFEVHLDSKKSSELKFGIGASLTSLKSSESQNLPELSNSTQNSSGFDFELRYIASSKGKIAFSTKINYLSKRGYSINYEGLSRNYETTFDYSSFNLSAGINCGFFYKNALSIEVYSGLGISLPSLKNPNRQIDTFIGNSIFLSSDDDLAIKKIAPMADLDIILNYQKSQNHYYFLSVANNFSLGELSKDGEAISLNGHTIGLKLGVGYYLK